MMWLYVGLSYVVILFAGFIGFNHLSTVKAEKARIETELKATKENYKMVIADYAKEQELVAKSVKERKATVKEIVIVAKGKKDEECLNTTISSDVLERLRKHGNQK